MKDQFELEDDDDDAYDDEEIKYQMKQGKQMQDPHKKQQHH